MENKTVKPKNHTIIHIFVMVLAIIMGAIFINGLVSAAKDYYINTHANFVQEYATVVRYEAVHRQHRSGYVYTTYYEYEADGWLYSGICQRNILDEEEAKAQIGKKVPIYVDHTLHHHSTTLTFTGSAIWFVGTLSFVCILIFTNSFVREIIFIVRWKRYKEANKSESK